MQEHVYRDQDIYDGGCEDDDDDNDEIWFNNVVIWNISESYQLLWSIFVVFDITTARAVFIQFRLFLASFGNAFAEFLMAACGEPNMYRRIQII